MKKILEKENIEAPVRTCPNCNSKILFYINDVYWSVDASRRWIECPNCNCGFKISNANKIEWRRYWKFFI